MEGATGVILSVFLQEHEEIPMTLSQSALNELLEAIREVLQLVMHTAGTDADSHDVYFGTNPSPGAGELQGNQTGTSFNPGTLTAATTYYWRIDSNNNDGTTTGAVWSFQAAPVLTCDPEGAHTFGWLFAFIFPKGGALKRSQI